MMYILKKDNTYVADNPVQAGKYIATTYSVKAKQFTYTQAKNLLNNNRKNLKWVREFMMVEAESGKSVSQNEIKNKGNGGAYTGNREIEYNQKVVDDAIGESHKVLGLAGWSEEQLTNYKNTLSQNQSYCDAVLTDIDHAIRDRTKIAAHKRAIIVGIKQEWERKREKTKEAIRYVDIMIDATRGNYTLEKMKQEISKARPCDYKGRTKYYEMLINL